MSAAAKYLQSHGEKKNSFSSYWVVLFDNLAATSQKRFFEQLTNIYG